MGLEAYTILGSSLKKGDKIVSFFQFTKIYDQVNALLGSSPGPWKEPVKVKGSEA